MKKLILQLSLFIIYAACFSINSVTAEDALGTYIVHDRSKIVARNISTQPSNGSIDFLTLIGRSPISQRIGFGVYTAKLSSIEVGILIQQGMSVELDQPTFLGEFIPNDPIFPNQWHLHKTSSPLYDIDAPMGWEVERGDSEVIIAVVDSGLGASATYLNANIWTNQLEIPGNNIDDDNSGYVDDVHGVNTQTGNGTTNPSIHGTRVISVAADPGNDGQAGAGVCHFCKFIPVKVFTDGIQGGTVSQLAAGLDWIIQMKLRGEKIKVINLSMYYFAYSQLVDDYIDILNNLGVLVVGIPGNGGVNLNTDPVYPAVSNRNRTNFITIGSVNQNFDASAFSSYGTMIEFYAPGEGIITAQGANTGTSFAAPIVAGAAALLFSQDSSRSFKDVKVLLRSTTKTNYSFYPPYGGGIINLCALDPSNCQHPANCSGGDVDRDGEVSAADIDKIISCFGRQKFSPTGFGYAPVGFYCMFADIDGDDEVTAADIDIVISKFGETCD